MPIYNRPYWGRGDQQRPGGIGGVVFAGMPRPGRVVGWLLGINIIVFVLSILMSDLVFEHFTVKASAWWQLWRYVTFQFLHGGLFHLLFNMLGLYFLGMYLEADWGGRRFLRFYLICGAIGGVLHVLLCWMFRQNVTIPLLGASSGVYAVVVACAILYPHIRVILFLFPVPIRFAAALFLFIALVNVLMGISSALRGGSLSTSGVSDPAHLGGAAAAIVWVWALPRISDLRRRVRSAARQGAWERKMRKRAEEEGEIDRILGKIREEGIGSLTRREKDTLAEATKRQREEERSTYRQ